MSEFVFVDGPPNTSRVIHPEFASALKARPGEWAIWPVEFKSQKSAYSTASNIRRGFLKSFPTGQFEAVTTNMKVYVRYVGGEA